MDILLLVLLAIMKFQVFLYLCLAGREVPDIINDTFLIVLPT